MKMLERAKNLRNNMQIVDLEVLVPQDHLLRKIARAVNFTHIYDLVEHLYCEIMGDPQ